MKKLLLLFICTCLLVPMNGVTHRANASSVTEYSVTASASIYDINLQFYNIYDSVMDPKPAQSELIDSISAYDVYDSEGYYIEGDYDWLQTNAPTSVSINRSDYKSNASTTPNSALDASLSANSGELNAYAYQGFNITSSGKGLIKISFSYNMAATLSNFLEEGENYQHVSLFVHNQNDSDTWDELSWSKYNDIPRGVTDDTWSIEDGIGEMFVPVEANGSYLLDISLSIYTNTAQPLPTPVPPAVWLLGSGLIGLARFKNRIIK